MFCLQLYHLHIVPVVNTMPNKTTIRLEKPLLDIAEKEQHYTEPIDLGIMKGLVYTGHCSSLSGDLDAVKGNNDCAAALNFNTKISKIHCSISVKHISRNSIIQMSPKHYLMAIMQNSTVECKCSAYTVIRSITPPLAIIILPEGCSIFTMNSFTFKVPITIPI